MSPEKSIVSHVDGVSTENVGNYAQQLRQHWTAEEERIVRYVYLIFDRL